MATATTSLNQQAQVCKACHHPRLEPGRQTIAVTFVKAIAEQAENGCIVCDILRRVIWQFVRDDKGLMGERSQNEPDLQVDTVRLALNMGSSERSFDIFLFGLNTNISLFCRKQTPWLCNVLPDLPVARPVPKSTASDESLLWVRKQLEHCAEHHSACTEKPDRRAIHEDGPARVLDIGLSDIDPVSLVPDFASVSRQTRPIPYVCLSHCWGRRPFLKTESANYKQHCHQIPWETLPLTFQETILLVRKLGVRHLWIDSLCIIQDDAEDWRREAAKMASVYQNCVLVVSASKSRSAHDGLFSTLTPDHEIHSLLLKADAELASSDEALCFRRSLSHAPDFLDRRMDAAVPVPTMTRGWIFQERFLSPRVLHFSQEELFWECLCQSTCQCGAIDTPAISPESSSTGHHDRVARSKYYYSESRWRDLVRNDKFEVGEQASLWHRLVEDYSRLSLTYDSDVFPAISGLATSFQHVFKHRYVAGMWEATLYHDLLWHSQRTTGTPETKNECAYRPSTWTAPSWSWASIKGPVEFIQTPEGLEIHCDIVDAQCESVGIDSKGELKGGHLLVRTSHIFPTQVSIMQKQDGQDRLPWNTLRLSVAHNRVSNVWIDGDIFTSGHDHLEDGELIHCLPIGSKRCSGALEVLLLKKMALETQPSYSCYTRLGLAEFPRPRPGQPCWVDEFLRPGQTQVVKLV